MARPKKVVEVEKEVKELDQPTRLNSDLQEVLDRNAGTYKKKK